MDFPGATAQAASNYEGDFQGQSSDVFSALGFDLTELPTGFEAETTENPYGRDTFTGNQVFELLLAGASSYTAHGMGTNDISIDGMTSSSASSATMPGVQLAAGAVGDFDGDGLAGEVAYVGVTPASGSATAELKLFVFDAKTGAYSGTKELGGITPYNTVAPLSGGLSEIVYDNAAVQQSKRPYAWQNLLQISAGDYDGDGVSEIAVYVADNDNPRVDIYKYQRKSSSGKTDWLEMSGWQRQWSYAVPKFENYVANMVSLVSGDFNRDGVDDLAISHGNSVFYTYNNLITRLAGAYASSASVLWGSKTSMLQTLSALDLGAGNSKLGALARVSLTFGDVNGDGVDELVMSGQPVDDLRSNKKRAVATYIYDEGVGLFINLAETIKVVDGDYVEAEGQTEFASTNGFDDKYFSSTCMRTNPAVFNPADDDFSYIYVDSVLVQYNNDTLSLKYELDDKNYNNSSESYLSGYWGNFLTADDSDNYTYSSSYVEYNAISGDVNGDGFDTLNVSFMKLGSSNRLNVSLAGVGGGLKSNMNHRTFSSSLVAATMPDCDYDTVLIQYSGIHELSYSDPEVIAIIAAAPYFEDVDSATGYAFAENNTTSFSTMEGSGSTSIFSTDFSIGGYVSAEISAFGKGELETSLGFTLAYEKEWGSEKEYTLTYETNGNEDAVAFYCIPIETFTYYIYTPTGDGKYTMEETRVVRNFSPVNQVLSLDYYESIQGNYDALPQIRGTVLTSTPGDPASYPSSSGGYDVVEMWNRTPAGVSFGNGSITQEISMTSSESETYVFGGYWDFKLGGGVHFECELSQVEVDVTGGVEWSLGIGGGYSNVNLSGTTISGTIANMPEQFRDYGYYFNWKLFSYRYKFGDSEIPVVSYIVNDVSKPPVLPVDFQQDYDRTQSTENCLTWTYSGNATKFLLYKYHDFPEGGGFELLEEIPVSQAKYTVKYDSNQKPYFEYYYIDKGLTPYTEYQYAIQIERIAAPPLSTVSYPLTARTKTDSGYPTMTLSESDGKDDLQLLVYPDKNAYLTVNVTGPYGESISNAYSTVQYQWQKKINGAWSDMTNSTDKTLTYAAAGIDTAGDYRCRVNVQTKQNAQYISAYTDFVTVSHSKRTSHMDEVRVTDADGGGVELYAKVVNSHADSGTIPDGTVDFVLTSTKTGNTYTASGTLDGTGTASLIIERTLPAGMYAVEAYYNGSYIFKTCSGATLFLSQSLSGYSIDALDTVTYGDGADITFEKVEKAAGKTNSEADNPDKAVLLAADPYSTTRISGAEATKDGKTVVAGKAYSFKDLDGISYYFTATRSGTISIDENYVFYNEFNDGIKACLQKNGNATGKYKLLENTPAGSYVIEMTSKTTDAVVVRKSIVVAPKNIALRLPTEKVNEDSSKQTEIDYPVLSDLEIVSGGWAACDVDTNGALKADPGDTTVVVSYMNTAGKKFDNAAVNNICGYYTSSHSAGVAVAPNYYITFIDGSVTVLGGLQNLSVAGREFKNEAVGTVYTLSPEFGSTRARLESGNELKQEYPGGTRVILSAVPDEGYEVYDWIVDGVSQGVSSNSYIFTMWAEDAEIEVQFGIKRTTLTFGTEGDSGGGTIECTSGNVTSGSVVIANSHFEFTAKANPGYHFKEWRYSVAEKGTAYYDEDNGESSSFFDFYMPGESCSVYAVFERDFYTLNLNDRSGNNGLAAWYYDSAAGAEKVYVASGERVKGDTQIIVGAAAGYSIAPGMAFVSEGSQGKADYSAGTYTFSIKQDTTVSNTTVHNKYDVTLELELSAQTGSQAPADAAISYIINGKEGEFRYASDASTTTLDGLDGGRPASFSVEYPEYYDFVGWISSETSMVQAVVEPNHVAVGITDANNAVDKGQPYYFNVVVDGTTTTYYFVATESGVANWDVDGKVTITITDPSYSIPALSSDVTLKAILREKELSTITLMSITDEKGEYSYEAYMPEGSFTTKDGSDNTVLNLHTGDDIRIAVIPGQTHTVTYWQIKDLASGETYKNRATYLSYSFQSISGDYEFTPIFAVTTYNTISWPKIDKSLNGLTLTPESGYLESVASGDSFKFKLSGSGLDLVGPIYANGNEFTAAGNKVGDTTYSYEDGAKGRIYSIDNIKENQVITATFESIGVTVNGVDISAFNGTGWTYSPATQKLSISNSGLTVSGGNNPSRAPGFSIETGESVGTLTFKNLEISTNAAIVLTSMRSEPLTLTLSGSNSITSESEESSVTLIKAVTGLTARGTGALKLSAETAVTVGKFTGIDATSGVFTVTGSATVDIIASSNPGSSKTTAAYGVYADTLTVGAQGLETSPTLRVNLTSSGYNYSTSDVTGGYESGVYVNSCNVYGGNLFISAPGLGMTAKSVNSYGGITEIKGLISYMPRISLGGSGNLITDLNNYFTALIASWRAYYPNGYQLSTTDAAGYTADLKTSTVKRSEYTGGGFNHVAIIELKDDTVATFSHMILAPLDSAETAKLTVTDSNNNSYSAVLTREYGKFLYLGGDGTIRTGDASQLSADPDRTLDAGTRVVAEWTTEGLELCAKTVEFKDEAVDASKQLDTDTATYAYEISGDAEAANWSLIADDDAVASLTLNQYKSQYLQISDAPLFLKGNNFLTARLASPISVSDAELNLHSNDGKGTLTLTTGWQASAPVIKSENATDTIKINLYNVNHLTMYGGTTAVMSGVYEVKYYDAVVAGFSDVEGAYGRAWKQDAALLPSAAESRTLTAFDGSTSKAYRYVKLYSSGAEAQASTELYFDKAQDASGNIVKAGVQYPVSGGEIYRFYPGDAACTVKLIGAPGDPELVSGTDFTWSALEQEDHGDITVQDACLRNLDTGSYTLRMTFNNDNLKDSASYSLDIPLTIVDTSVSSGGITISPAVKSALRGGEVSFKTAFTGPTPASYSWELIGAADTDPDTGTKLVANGANAKLTIGLNESFGNISVKVTSYSDTNNSVVLGYYTATVTVSNSASTISIFCQTETPSGDGNFTLNHTANAAKTWDFDASIVLDSGEQPDLSKLEWSLWGNTKTKTELDPATGELTIDPFETGTGGIMKLTATYTNGDGSKSEATSIIRLSDDAHVSYKQPTENGTIASVKYENGSISETSGTWIKAGSKVTATAAPDDGYSVSAWYLDGIKLSSGEDYTIDADKGTLSFTAAAAKVYKIEVAFVNNNAHTVEYSAGENGSVSAIYNGNAFASGGGVTEGGEVILTATPDEHCEVAAWRVNGKTPSEAGAVVSGNRLTLPGISESFTVTVSFRGKALNLSYMTEGEGALTAFVNGGKRSVASKETGKISTTANALDTTVFYANPAENHQVKGWYLWNGTDYVMIPGSAEIGTYTVDSMTESLDLKVEFEPSPMHKLKLYTGTYLNGNGTIIYGANVIPESGSGEFDVMNYATAELLAVAGSGSQLYKWEVTGADYIENGDYIRLTEITGDVTVTAIFCSNAYNVSVSGGSGGGISAEYAHPVDGSSGTISNGETAMVKGGSRVTFEVSPAVGNVIDTMTVNGLDVEPVYDKNAGAFVYSVNTLSADLVANVTFTMPTIFEVTAPTAFDDAGTASGTIGIEFVEDGVSGDQDNTDARVEIAAGGAAEMTFEAAPGYMVNTGTLSDEIENVLKSVNSNAEFEIIIKGQLYVVRVMDIDMNLDFSGMASPFELLVTPVNMVTVTYGNVENGTLVARYDGAILADGAEIPENSKITITATPDEHYGVMSMAVNGAPVGSPACTANAEYGFEYDVDTNAQLSSTFGLAEFKVSIDVVGTGKGTVSAEGETKTRYFPAGSNLNVTASAADSSSKLVALIVDGTTIDGSAATITDLRNDVKIVAQFDTARCVVTYETPANGTLTVKDGEGNIVPSGTQVDIGKTLIIFAEPAENYRLDSLTAGGVPVTGNTYKVDAAKDNVIKCSFTLAKVQITWKSSEGGALDVKYPNGSSVINGGYVDIGTSVRVHAEANANYSLDSLKLNGGSITNNNSYVVSEAMDFEASFKYNGGGGTTIINEGDTIITDGKTPLGGGDFTVAISSSGSGSVKVVADGAELVDGQLVVRETVLTITASGANGAMLKSLTVNGIEFKSGSTYEVFANTEIKAVFENALPYYLDADENKVFIGLSYDSNGNGVWDAREYIIPSGKKVMFAENEKDFVDIENHWGLDMIDFVTEREIFVGTSANIFSPDTHITRAMFVAAIGRLYERSYGQLESSGSRTFADCNYDDYYGKYVDWAAENGIVKGYNEETFMPNRAISRQEMATLIYNFAQFMDALPETPDTELKYTDSDEISDWAKQAALFCQTTEIIKGVGGGVFAPNDTSTRAQAAGILKNFIVYYFS